jgi:uncharacterized phage-associated protein
MDFIADKEKIVEALVYVASRLPGVGRFHAAKILYFAERDHLRTFGRPLLGDRFVAMENGPVPSFAYDVLKGTVSTAEKELVDGALIVGNASRHPNYRASRAPRLEYFSKSDLECLDSAIKHCRARSFGAISDETHKHAAWIAAKLNGPMEWDLILEGADPEVVEEAHAFASYGVM